MASDEALLHIFVGTLSADKTTREQAEATLTHISTDSRLITRLIHFSCQELPFIDVPAAMQQALQAASIRVRNVLGRSDWNRNPYFTEETKSAVRECIVPLQCASHVPELVRRQLLAATQSLIRYDYPHRWPSLMPQLRRIVDECGAHLCVLSAAASSREVATLRLKGALGILRECCKVYNNPIKIDADDIEAFIDAFSPVLLSLTETLVSVWTQELLAQQTPPPPPPPAPQQVNGISDPSSQFSTKRKEKCMFVLSSWHNELSHCLRIALKCIHSLTEARWPRFLCDQSGMDRLCKGCLGQLLDASHKTLLPLYRLRILSNDGDDSDLFSVFHESAVWKLLKWTQGMCLKMMQDLMFPKRCERRARAAAKYFCDHYLLGFVQHALDLVRWHATPRHLTSKAYIMSLEILTMAVDGRETYRNAIAPNAEEIFTSLIFPRLTFSAEDAELWTSNPAEYVRLQTSPTGDLYSAKVVSSTLMLTLAASSKPFHDAEFVHHVVQYVLERLTTHAKAAAQGDMEAARVVDACLFAIYQFNKVLRHIGFGDDRVEWLLTNYVAPAAKYPVGFLRARSVLVLSVFASKIHWSSPQAFQFVLSEILPLLQDPEMPVRMQACASIASLICHPHARDVIAPCISDVIQHYFYAMRLMDSEGVVRTLRRTIKHYRDVLSQWALHLTEMLVQHFLHVLERVLAEEFKDSEFTPFTENTGSDARLDPLVSDEDAVADTIMTADEVLETLTTLVRAVSQQEANSSSNASGEGGLILQMQERIAPLLYVVLSREKGSCLGFMDASLMLLTTILSLSSAVASPMWRLLPCIHQLIVQGAVDYFYQMLPPLDNFVSVAPEQFLFFQMSELCAVPEFAANMDSMTPAQIVCMMCDTVMQSSHILRLRDLSAVPKVYDSILQNLWLFKQREGGDHTTAIAMTDSLVEYILQAALRVLNDSSSQEKRRRTLTLLFANNVLSAILANAALTVKILSSAGALLPFFVHYTRLVQEETMQVMLRSYDRRLFVMAVAALARLQMEQGALAVSLEEVLCGVLEGEVLEKYSHREGAIIITEVGMRESLSDGDDYDEEEWSGETESDSGDDDEMEDEEDEEEEEALGMANDKCLQSLLHSAAVVLKRDAATAAADDGDDDEEEEDNLLDETDFVAPIDARNAWAFLLESFRHASTAAPTRFCQLLGDANSQRQLQSIMQLSDAVEQLLASRGRPNAADSLPLRENLKPHVL
ncbi:hypothetical protein MOQ_001226 [Trypanosoma cruzi marinkellei]|uniref:Importin N-terminal domain-containing protein n=1 Tax=Trypanosoma cruzi marinkellei TaxID=85056 RepID=K2NLD3_TRYCR|nr:hypothetical protein MOQ_001226 [Trypanosoma cruzi marinkellei]